VNLEIIAYFCVLRFVEFYFVVIYMKNALLLALLLSSFLLFSCSHNDHSHHDHDGHSHGETSLDLGDGYYGFEKIDDSKATPSEDVYNLMTENDSAEVLAQGKITKMCQTVGCWAMVQLNDDEEILVKFRDEFSIPLDSEGKRLAFKGTAKRKIVSIEELRENAIAEGYSQEQAETEITKPLIEITVLAEGVSVK